MANKIKPGGVVGGTQFGTTYHDGDTHAPTLRGSSTAPKHKIAPNGINTDEPCGTTFTHAGTHIKMGNADKAPSSTKVKSSGSADKFIPKGKGTLSMDDTMVKNPPVKKR